MSYKVGDKVRIVDKWADGSAVNFEGLMDKWLGKVMTIQDILLGDLYWMEEDKDENDGRGWLWSNIEIAGLANDDDVTNDNIAKDTKPTFKVGDRVKSLPNPFCKEGLIGTIICREGCDWGVDFDEDVGFWGHNCDYARYDEGQKGTSGRCLWLRESQMELVEKRRKGFTTLLDENATANATDATNATDDGTRYNGSVVCVDLCGKNSLHYTVGKVYKFVDGRLTTNIGEKLPSKPCRTFDDWVKFTGSKFIEVVD